MDIVTNRNWREYQCIRAAWKHWVRPVDLAEKLRLDRKLIAKTLAELRKAGFMVRRGTGPNIHYRTRAASYKDYNVEGP